MTSEVVRAKLEALLESEILPASFRSTVETVFAPLSAEVLRHWRHSRRSLVVGVCGPQGSGKSTGAKVIQILLQAEGLRVAILALDDLYLTRDQRSRLASFIHPLLATRGPPGSHDDTLGLAVLDHLLDGSRVTLPAFDKATDDRRPADAGTVFEGPADVVLFEGWCVGAIPEAPEALNEPINDLERDRDADGIWRQYINAALVRYQGLFARIDFQILLLPPGFDVVARWRREQEAKLRARTRAGGPDLRIMSDAEVDRFVQHYERLTRHIIQEMPARADAVVELGPDRALQRLYVARPAA